MPSSPSSLLKLELQNPGENNNTWGTINNTQLELLEQAVSKMTAVTVGGIDITLDDSQYVSNQARAAGVKLTGTLSNNIAIIVPARTKNYLVWNASSGAFTATVKTSGGTGVVIPQGYALWVMCDGTDVLYAGIAVVPASGNTLIGGDLLVSGNATLGNADTDAHVVNGLLTMASKPINEFKGANLASAGTTDIGAATGNFVDITGTTTITVLGTIQAGTRRRVRFTGILTLTHNATSLILPTGADIVTAAGDTAEFYSLGSGNWLCTDYQRASGRPLAVSDVMLQCLYQEYSDYTLVSGVIPFDDTIPQQSTDGEKILEQEVTPLSAGSRLRIRFQGVGGVDPAGGWAAALFVDSDEDAIAASCTFIADANNVHNITIEVEVDSVSTATRTYKLHVGPAQGIVLSMNGGGGRLFGGTSAATLIVEEVLSGA